MTLEELIELSQPITNNSFPDPSVLDNFINCLKDLSTPDLSLLSEFEGYLKAQLNTSAYPGEVESLLGCISQLKGEPLKAIQYFESARGKGSLTGTNNRAYMHQYGIGGPINSEEAIRLYDLAIARGLPVAITNKANMHQDGIDGRIDLEEAIRLYDLAIAKDYTAAMHLRAYMHQYGIGGSANFPEAIRLYDLAIAKGNSVAMLRRAYMYQKAIGGPENLPEAIRLYDLAITKGNSAAMQKRAYMHQRGIGGPVNLEKAIRLYDLAVTKGLPIAMINRAYMHEKAIGGPENLLEAIRLYDLAINKGHSYAMVHRAQMYENGIGGEKNIPKAIDLWIHALTSDNEAWSKTYGHNALDNLIRITTCYPHPPIKAKIAIFIIFMQGICGIPMDKHRAGLYHKDSIEFIEALLDIYILQLIGIPTYFPTIVDATISFLKASIHPNSLPLFKFKEIEARQALLAENGEKALESLLSLPLEYFSNSEHLLHFIMLILNCVGPDQKSIILPHLDRGIRCFPESKDLDKLHRFLLLEIEGKIQELSDESKENKTQRYAKALARETSFIDMKIKSAIIAFESYIESSIIKLCGLCSSIWHHKDIHLAQMILVSLRAGQSPYIVYSNHRQELKEFPVLNNLLINHCYYTPTIIEKPTAAKPNLLAQNVFANADATASTGLNTATSLSPA